MTPEHLKRRTKAFALSVIRLVSQLPRDYIVSALAKQLVRAATSVGANYRAACRAKSPADFIAKLKIVEEEADECLYWMELLEESQSVNAQILEPIKKEANEILAIVVASIKTKRERM